MDRPTITPVLEVGDTAAFGFNWNTDQPAVSCEFPVTGINGTVIDGGPDVLGVVDTANGWEYQVTRKATVTLPTELSMIAAVFIESRTEPVKLIGYGTEWQVDGGGHINPGSILAWEPWADWAARWGAYVDWENTQTSNGELL